ncbi:MAG: hypothetical protein NDI62_02530 [Burkholderiales bacterium]|nr:hypothetical protein [Burkholderiales bacterium]
MEKVIINNQEILGSIWAIGWLFTIGYLQLTFWKGLLSLIIWPYYLGVKFSKEPKIEEVK